MRIDLIGGAYSARSRIAACTRSINYFPEGNPKGSAIVPMTNYQSPGFTPLLQPQDNKAPVRQVYLASNGEGFCVIGLKVYYISPQWALTLLGTLQTIATTPCYFSDNGNEALLVDGSQFGYKINLDTHAFSLVSVGDPDGFFAGGVRVDTIDGFLLWNEPGTKIFKSTLDFQITPFDLTYFASKVGYQDKLQGLFVNRRQILLIGALKSEIWINTGGAQFPFAEVPGTYIEHGTCAPYSIASSDVSTFCLSQSLRGVGYVLRIRGYEATIISNYALSVAIRKMQKGGTITDAIGYTYTQDGHEFYVLQFPSGNQTWVWDDSVKDPELGWHQRCWTDAQGGLNRDRGNCAAWLYGENVVGDWENGTIYKLDLESYQDLVDGTTYARTCIRTFPHLSIAQVDFQGAPPVALGQQVKFEAFVLDVESGEGAQQLDQVTGVLGPARIGLRWSSDRGKTWGQTVLQSNGNPGEFITQPKWSATGSARDMIFEISHSINGPVALNGAWTKATMLGN